jgi:transcriptional regulator with XRE-family HTH domain
MCNGLGSMRQSGNPQPALGEAVRHRRMERELNLTQRALADKAGITVAHLSKLEKGRTNPTWGTMRKIAEALELSLADLAARAEEFSAIEDREQDALPEGAAA